MATLEKCLWMVIGMLLLDAPGGMKAFTPRKSGDESGDEDPIVVSWEGRMGRVRQLFPTWKWILTCGEQGWFYYLPWKVRAMGSSKICTVEESSWEKVLLGRRRKEQKQAGLCGPWALFAQVVWGANDCQNRMTKWDTWNCFTYQWKMTTI